MRAVQSAAVAMFEIDGFDATTVESVAERSGVSASTIYRQFGTKEKLVLWDERDPVVDAELVERLGRQSALEAFRDAVTVALVDRDDSDLFLRRLRLIYAEPTILGAAAQQEHSDRIELAEAFAATERRKKVTIADEITAAVCLAALDVALDHWQKSNAETDLGELISQTIAGAASPG